ncbi:MAG: energy-coupling factor transporter transmembrane component T family protein [Christensenellales bacterium]
MLKNITIGQYFPGNSAVHRMDARMKILLTVALLVAVFVSRGFVGFAVIFAFVLIIARSTRIGLKFIMRGLKPILFIVIFTFVLNLFMQTGGETIVTWKFMRITTGGLRTAIYMAIRLMLLVVASQLLTLTTSSLSLTDGMEALMKPLAKIKFPAHEIAMMMSIALRFIPTLMEETDKIMNAQKARGADFESGNIIKRAKAMVPLLVPLFVSAFRRADELALAMEARCYRGGVGRTRMNRLTMTRLDAYAACVVGLMVVMIFVFNALGVP